MIFGVMDAARRLDHHDFDDDLTTDSRSGTGSSPSDAEALLRHEVAGAETWIRFLAFFWGLDAFFTGIKV